MTFTANGKRLTAKMKLLLSVFSSLHNRIKIFVFAVDSKRQLFYFCMIYLRLQEKNRKWEEIFAVCRLP